MPKNRNSRSKKIARQAKARLSRNLPPSPRLVASPAEAHASFAQVATSQCFSMAGPDGQTWQVPMERLRAWHEAAYAANGEPALEPGELAEILTHDIMFGRLRLRTDGLWESDQPYFAAGADA